jgi:Mg/Co/Ni transporter MgtE
MPVVTDDGALAGIITMDDLLDLLAEQLAALVAMVGRGQRRESDRHP